MSAPLLVADSGPLIALARLDLLSLPARYFASVLLTVALESGHLGLAMSAAVLIDEKLGRPVGSALGLHVVGTLGQWLRAWEEGILPSLRTSLENLRASGYFLSSALIENLLTGFG